MKKTIKSNCPNHLRTVCLICNKEFKHLGSHLYNKHKIRAQEYKTKYGLPHGLALISDEVEQKKRDHFNKHRDKYLKNLRLHGARYQFKQGQKISRYRSRIEMERVIKQIQDINKKRKPEKYPVCNQIFDNLDTHLFMKHGLLRARRF